MFLATSLSNKSIFFKTDGMEEKNSGHRGEMWFVSGEELT